MPHHDDNDEWIKELGRRKGAFGSQAIGRESRYYGPGEAGMPFKSHAQRRKFAELLVEGKISCSIDDQAHLVLTQHIERINVVTKEARAVFDRQ